MTFLAQITSNDNLLLGIIVTAGGAMAGAITHLYFRDATKSKELVDMVSKEFTECKKDRDELRKMYYELNGKFSAISRGQE
jgi:gas vesicle protein